MSHSLDIVVVDILHSQDIQVGYMWDHRQDNPEPHNHLRTYRLAQSIRSIRHQLSPKNILRFRWFQLSATRSWSGVAHELAHL